MFLWINVFNILYNKMSRDDEFGIIQIENLWEDSYKSPEVLNVW